jgi:glyoxylase-like metal-dependent hydrolase (beta-lactamase superfamily II)
MGICQPSPLQTIRVGDISITYLPDGEGHFVPSGMFPASAPEAWAAHERWLDGDGRYVVTIGAFLVRTGDRTVIVDLGLGADVDIEIPEFATARSGKLLDSLRSAGLEAADVDTVVYTHLHSDHAGWTSRGGGVLTFPNAEHVIGSSAEFEFWRANADVPFAPPAESVLDPLENRLTTASDGHSVAPGVTLRATPGHTPGHQTVIVSSGADRAVIMGDIMHCPVQLVEPEWSVLFDIDAAMARATREKLLDELEGTDTAVACGHFPEAAFGRVLRGEGKRYWSPTP